jgi:hypothetical protein
MEDPMSRTNKRHASLLAASALLVGASVALSQANGPDAGAQAGAVKTSATTKAMHLAFESDALGGPAKGVEAVIGDWSIAEQGGARGLAVDGSRWRNGVPSANLADQARRLYGERYAEFLDGVKAFAFFPLAVVEQPPPPGNVRLSVRFYPTAGKIDQAAGIAFGIQPDGSYFGVRANALEDNILWFKVVRGKRSIIDTIRNTPTPTKTWHTLVVSLRGKHMEVALDGKSVFHKELAEVPRGKVGLWSKADSQVLFDDFVVEALRLALQ